MYIPYSGAGAPIVVIVDSTITCMYTRVRMYTGQACVCLLRWESLVVISLMYIA